jgi:hypothetical protein
MLVAVMVTFEPLRIGGCGVHRRILACAAAIYFGYRFWADVRGGRGLAIGHRHGRVRRYGIFLTALWRRVGLVSGRLKKRAGFSALACLICMAGFTLWNGLIKSGITGCTECLPAR